MRRERIERVKQQLSRKKGLYKNGNLKKGYEWLSGYFNEEVEIIKEAVKDLKGQDISNKVKYKTTSFTKNLVYTKSSSEIIIDRPGTYWITGCAHAPWHNEKMYNSTLNYISKEIPLSGIIIAGDFVDLNSISFHDRGNVSLPGVTLEYEYEKANKLLDQIDSVVESSSSVKPTKIFLYGNHEDRYNRLLKLSDASKYGEALKSPSEGLKLARRGYSVLTNWKSDHVNIGKFLEVNHGEFFNVHTAKKTIDTYRKSVLYFHSHRFQVYMEGLVAGWNMGCGADINAPIFNYASRAMKNSWVNSSALVTLDKDGYYHVEPLLFINNKLVIGGKEY